MGETRRGALRLDFDRRLKLEFHGTKVTSDAELLAYRELDEALGLIAMIHSELRDIRTGKKTQHGLAALLRQAVYSRFAGRVGDEEARVEVVEKAAKCWSSCQIPRLL